MYVTRRRPRPGWPAKVLAGGASVCAMQVGMLQALHERGIVADLLVGASACALNAAFVGSRPQSQTTTNQLARAWCAMRCEEIVPLAVRAPATMTGGGKADRQCQIA